MKTLHHLLLTSLALGLLTGRAGAEIFPVFEDAAGSVKAGTITKAGGTAKTLAISKTSNAYLNFLVSSAEMNPAFISAARLVIFLPKTTPKGVISIHALTSEWTETLTTPKITAPALGTLIDEIDLEDIPLKADYYIADVTNLVKFWMNNPEEEFGLALVSDGVANVTLASKEGFTSGHPAFIEIDYNQARSESNTYISAQSTTDSLAGFFATNSTREYYMGIGLNASDWMLFDNVAQETRLLLNSSGQIGMGGSPEFGRLTLQGIDLGSDVSGILDMKDLEGIVQWHTTLENGGLNFVEANASDERFFLQAGGNVGIGTRFPASQLHVKRTDPGSTLLLQGGDAEGENPPARAGLAFSYFDSPIAKHFITTNHSTSTPANNKMGFWLNNRVGASPDDAPGNGTTQVMTLTGQGRVGIGTISPVCSLDVRLTNNTFFGHSSGHRWFNNTSSGLNTTSADFFTSINADQYVRAFGFLAVSDQRIKKDVQELDTKLALQQIEELKVCDYRMIDKIDCGDGTRTGFIAQEVEKVMPDAVSISAAFIPDIYRAAASVTLSKDGGSATVALDTPHHLSVGDLVRVIADAGEAERKVTGVLDAKTFTVETQGESWTRLFVFGRQVKDFRSVDYPRVFTKTVAALQQLKKEKDSEAAEWKAALETMKSRFSAQEKELAELRAKDAARDTQLAAIHALLRSSGKAQALPAALKKDTDAE